MYYVLAKPMQTELCQHNLAFDMCKANMFIRLDKTWAHLFFCSVSSLFLAMALHVYYSVMEAEADLELSSKFSLKVSYSSLLYPHVKFSL